MSITITAQRKGKMLPAAIGGRAEANALWRVPELAGRGGIPLPGSSTCWQQRRYHEV